MGLSWAKDLLIKTIITPAQCITRMVCSSGGKLLDGRDARLSIVSATNLRHCQGSRSQNRREPRTPSNKATGRARRPRDSRRDAGATSHLVRGHAAAFAQLDDLIEDALGYVPLGGFGDFDDLVVSNDMDGVAVGVEADAFARNVVHDNRVQRFAG